MDLIDLVSEEERLCLTQTIYHEARGESYHGQLVVGFLVANRVDHEWYPNDFCDVVYQRKQFSFIDDLDTLTMFEKDAKQFAKDVSYIVLTTPNPLPDNVLLFHGDHISIPDDWDKDLVEEYAHLGNHILYEEYR